ncbi:protein argonaute-2-like [Thrips palmi]|uniref:Protein argonaute-2-like n=1 Tax=Thrips palmi TaxID=161013 RepID=A0A6P8YKV3_THRPL|nr:protein argonaute-2-like [Thrips palmi]XP_034237386.1 protein argonaute-2-like [Thrips palmi]
MGKNRKGKGKGGGQGDEGSGQASKQPSQAPAPQAQQAQQPAQAPQPPQARQPAQAQQAVQAHPHQNPGQGQGQNPVQGRGQQPGQGQGQQPGQGRGGGQQPGQGRGRGQPGQGRGGGQQPGQGQGQQPGLGRGRGQGRGQNPGQVQGQHPGQGGSWGGGHQAPVQQQQVPAQQQGAPWGRGNQPPGQQQQAPAQQQGAPWGRGNQPPAQQQQAPAQQQGAPWGHGNQAPAQQQAAPWGHGQQAHAQQQGVSQAPAPKQGPSPSPQQAQGQHPQPSQPVQRPPSVQRSTPSGPSGDSGKQAGPLVALPQRANCPPDEKLGRKIPLEVNHLLLKMRDPNIKIFHYDVTIDPDKPKRFMRLVMQEMQKRFYPNSYPGFDGRKNLYSKGLLPFGNELHQEVTVPDEERSDKAPKPFKVTIKLARSNISLDGLFAYQKSGASSNIPQDVIQAVDVILRSASARNFIQVGRSFFCPQERPLNLGSGMELWLGFFQSFIMGHKPYINIDVAHKGFPMERPLLDILQEFAPNAKSPSEALQNQYTKSNFEKFIKGLKVEYKIPRIDSSKRTYRVNGLRKNAFDERFELADGRKMCIGEYFEKEKQYKLRFPGLPCIHVGPREKDILVPMELCLLIGGQPTMKKLDENQTSRMVKAAATNVEDRKRKIREAMRRANINASLEVKEFGLSVTDDFTQVSGRILPAPKLAYNKGFVVEPQRGVWRGGPFLQTRHLKKWIIVSTMERFNPDCLKDFSSQLINEGRRSNLIIEKDDPTIFLNDRSPRLKNDLKSTFENLKSNGYDLVVVVISGYNKLIYGQVKQAAEIQVGILTQCVKDQTLYKRLNQPTIHNILLKINAKFNGINQVIADSTKLKCLGRNILVIGADVTHPSPDSKDIPSVAAVTASHDLKGFKYNMKIRLQPPRVEIIQDLQNIVREQLAIYQKETNSLPEHIFFYRDGVSEGQFQQVLHDELRAIQQACDSFKIKSKITFLVVQKRHHTRFFPMNPRDSHDRNGNVPAGTIVDTDITHPTEIDFYLVSHASIQGVARPTKYHVLWDDAKMSENEIQMLTYSLCHLFTRCDRAVSYPAPTYYAHLAASRGRVYLEGQNIVLDNLKREGQKLQTAMNFTNVSPMYFV